MQAPTSVLRERAAEHHIELGERLVERALREERARVLKDRHPRESQWRLSSESTLGSITRP